MQHVGWCGESLDSPLGLDALHCMHEQALGCLSNREIVDASRGRTFHCKMANNRLITVFFL